jgi:hypothetical protein
MAQLDLTPKPGRKTEVLAGGPCNGTVLRKTRVKQVNVVCDPVWMAIYLRRDGRLQYLASINKPELMFINPWLVRGGLT